MGLPKRGECFEKVVLYDLEGPLEELIFPAHSGQDSKLVWRCSGFKQLERTGVPANRAIQTVEQMHLGWVCNPVVGTWSPQPLMWAFLRKHTCSDRWPTESLLKTFLSGMVFMYVHICSALSYLTWMDARLETMDSRLDYDKKCVRSSAVRITTCIECFLCARHSAKAYPYIFHWRLVTIMWRKNCCPIL